MSPKILLPLFALAILLSACTASVITDEERELPAEEAQMEDSTFTGVLNENLEESFIAFVGSKGDIVSHECKFNDFSTTVEFVEGTPTSLEAVIQINSLETDTDKLTAHLLTADFFESDTYETATFTSTSIELMEDGLYFVTGTLTIKDVSAEENIIMDITESYVGAIHSIDRTDYNVGGPSEGLKAIDTDMPLEIKVELQ